MKIAFFGTSDRSVPILESIINNFDLTLCVTKNDSKVGRHQLFKETEVKKWAREHKVSHIEIENLRDSDLEKVLNKLRETGADLGIVADFSLIIPEGIINYFNNKLINIHFSLLPKFRGASPVQHAILQGEKVTGITFHLVNKELDAGDVLWRIEYNIPDNITSGELYHELFLIASENLPKVLNDYARNVLAPMPQDTKSASYTYSPTQPNSTFIFKEDAYVNWKEDVLTVYRKIKAYNPWPVAWSYLRDLENAEILTEGKIRLRKNINKDLKVKIYDAELSVNQTVAIKEIQIEGKRVTDWNSFKNGYLE